MSTRRLAGLAAAVVLVLAPASALVSGCSSSSVGSGTPAVAPATALPASGSTVDGATFAAALAMKKAVLVDVRTPAEFAAGHIAGATNIDVEAADFATKIGALDKGAAYALYCRSGNRSGVAMQAMLSSGFTHVFHLGGGIGAWQSAGQPVVQ
ncbi:MAG: rhodanese-like domain-containing protein [Dermatophilaceae bacterium]